MSNPGQPNVPGSHKTTEKGGFGGGNQYIQMPKIDKNMSIVQPRQGHTQKSNINYKPPGSTNR